MRRNALMLPCRHRQQIQRRSSAGRAGWECLRCGRWRPSPWYDGAPVAMRRVRPNEDALIAIERSERLARAKLAVLRRYGERQ